jgi:hypothetical protein
LASIRGKWPAQKKPSVPSETPSLRVRSPGLTPSPQAPLASIAAGATSPQFSGANVVPRGAVARGAVARGAGRGARGAGRGAARGGCAGGWRECCAARGGGAAGARRERRGRSWRASAASGPPKKDPPFPPKLRHSESGPRV